MMEVIASVCHSSNIIHTTPTTAHQPQHTNHSTPTSSHQPHHTTPRYSGGSRITIRGKNLDLITNASLQVHVSSDQVYTSKVPFIYLSIYFSIYLSINLSIHPFIHPSIYLSIHLSIHPFVHPSVYSSIHLFIHSLIHLFIFPSIYSSIKFFSIYPFIYPSIYRLLSFQLFIYPQTPVTPVTPHSFILFHTKTFPPNTFSLNLTRITFFH